MKKEKLSTIATRTGLSITTISRVLAGKAKEYRIADKTCETVREEAARCSYVPDFLAKSLRIGKTNTIGILVPSLSNHFFGTLASSLIEALRAKGFTAIIADTEEDDQKLQKLMNSIISLNVDGLIIVPCENSIFTEDVKIPIVFVDRYLKEIPIPYVTTDNRKGAYLATSCLLDAGHKRIACIQGNGSSPSKDRVQGYKDALEERRLSVLVEGSSFSVECGYESTCRLLARKDRPTAILVLSNNIMLGTLKALDDHSLSVPEDMSLIAFDDLPYMDFMKPRITRIGQPVTQIANEAVAILTGLIHNSGNLKTEVKLAPTLIQGDSIKKYL